MPAPLVTTLLAICFLLLLSGTTAGALAMAGVALLLQAIIDGWSPPDPEPRYPEDVDG